MSDESSSEHLTVWPPPRFMTEAELRKFFGLSERALNRLRQVRGFPSRDVLISKTDRTAVDRFFDFRAGIEKPGGVKMIEPMDGVECFD